MSQQNRQAATKQQHPPKSAPLTRRQRLTISTIALLLLVTMVVLGWLVWRGQMSRPTTWQGTPIVTTMI